MISGKQKGLPQLGIATEVLFIVGPDKDQIHDFYGECSILQLECWAVLLSYLVPVLLLASRFEVVYLSTCLWGCREQPPRGAPWVSGLVEHFVQTWPDSECSHTVQFLDSAVLRL